MKIILLFFVFATVWCSTVWADTSVSNPPAAGVSSTSSDPWLVKPDPHPYTQVFSLQGGFFQPASLSVSNSEYSYSYLGKSLQSYEILPSWGIKIFHLGGAFFAQEAMGISSFSASVPGSTDSLSLWMLSFDTRLKHSWEWFPLRWLIPFVEGGYRFSFYTQSGSSDFQSAHGTVGNVVFAGGIDFWINQMLAFSDDDVNRYSAIPVFLTAKVDRILPSSGEVNLDSTTFLVGLSLGI